VSGAHAQPDSSAGNHRGLGESPTKRFQELAGRAETEIVHLSIQMPCFASLLNRIKNRRERLKPTGNTNKYKQIIVNYLVMIVDK